MAWLEYIFFYLLLSSVLDSLEALKGRHFSCPANLLGIFKSSFDLSGPADGSEIPRRTSWDV